MPMHRYRARGRPPKYHAGDRWGMLTLITRLGPNKALFLCDCGSQTDIRWSSIMGGKTNCGCQKQGYIYFLKQGEFVKIGYSATPNARMATHQTSSPQKLTLIRMIPGSLLTEQWLFSYFGHLRIRPRSEWFKFSPEMLIIEPPY
jgi:hypothetical protein